MPFPSSISSLIQGLATPSAARLGTGLVNPPPLAPVLKKLGISEDPASAAKATKKPDEFDTYQPPKTTGSESHNPRRPFALTCQKWLERTEKNAIKYIYCKPNPRSVQWTMNLRTSDQRTLAGTVQHAWRQNQGVRRRTYFSEPVLTVTFQSGNLMPIYPEKFKNTKNPEKEITIPSGMDMFYRFADLIGDSRIISDGSESRANVVYIMYTSRLYPSIVLAGMFTPEGFSFNDASETPNSVEWTSTFTVYDSYPRFDSASDLISSWYSVLPRLTKPLVPPAQANAAKTTEEFLAEQSNVREAQEALPPPPPLGTEQA